MIESEPAISLCKILNIDGIAWQKVCLVILVRDWLR